MCCAIPIEYKLQPLECCGFPTGWRFAFDHPQHHPRSLLLLLQDTASRIFAPSALAGLKLVSPLGQVYQSLECAFANVVNVAVSKDGSGDGGVVDISAILSLVSRFMAHIGSSLRYEEITDHFLIGRQYCADFYSNSTTVGIHHSNTVLFGRIVACIGQVSSSSSSTSNHHHHHPPSSSPSSRTRANQRKKQQQNKKQAKARTQSSNLIFVVRYDPDILHYLSKTMNIEVPPIQFIPSSLAWGGCILYERKTFVRRDATTSVIQNIDRATSVETWIVPDMRMEEIVEHPVVVVSSSSEEEEEKASNETTTLLLPQLTVYARGYKFIFRVKEDGAAAVVRQDDDHDRQQQYSVFVSCTTMPQQQGSSYSNGDQEINLKPGELIDLGIVSPLPAENEMDCSYCCRKPLSSFLVKNFIHQFRPGRYAVLSDDGNSVYDLTDNSSGMLRDAATKRVVSYIRRTPCSARRRQHRRQQPQQHSTLHARLDPCGNIHLLFGIQYSGDWTKYENGMQQKFVPILCGGEIEVTTTSSSSFFAHSRAGARDDGIEAQCLQSISVFSIEEILSCSEQLFRMVDVGANLVQQYPSILLERCDRVVKCLLDRIDALCSMAEFVNGEITDDDASRSSSKKNVTDRVVDRTNSVLLPAINHLNKLSEALKVRGE
jgi:hypothetical protein